MGPAAAVRAKSLFGFLKYLEFIGTGFAQPMPRNIIESVPKRSKCFKGFKDMRPRLLAVGSPRR
jgi:hypothetical protein